MDFQNKKRGGRGKSGPRGRGGSRGRGNFRGQRRGNSRNQNLESNAWRFEEEDTMEDVNALRNTTLANCTRPIFSQKVDFPETGFSEQQIQDMDNLLSKLSIEEQTNFGFIVPMPPLDSTPANENQNPIKTENTNNSNPPIKKEEHAKPAPKPKEDLDSWLDSLLA